MCVLQPQCVTASAECLADEHIIVAVRSVDDMEVYGESCNSSWITCYNNLFFEKGFPRCQVYILTDILTCVTGECVLPLKPHLSQTSVPFQCVLTHNCEETGYIK